MGQLIKEPLTLANFGDGAVETEVNKQLAAILERFAEADDGKCALASEKASITIKLSIERSSQINGFACSFEEPKLVLPKKKRMGTLAVVEAGVLMVDSEKSNPVQIPLRSIAKE